VISDLSVDVETKQYIVKLILKFLLESEADISTCSQAHLNPSPIPPYQDSPLEAASFLPEIAFIFVSILLSSIRTGLSILACASLT